MTARVLAAGQDGRAMRALAEAMEGREDMRLEDHVEDGLALLRAVRRDKPNLVVLDLNLGLVDGLETLVLLRQRVPDTKVVVFSRGVEEGSKTYLRCLSAGAADVMLRPDSEGLPAAIDKLVSVIGQLCRKRRRRAVPAARGGRIQALVIGSSTGGPDALRKLFDALPDRLSVPVLLGQHMPEGFTVRLAERLAQVTAMPVVEGEEGCLVQPGHVYIAPGGQHMEVQRSPQGARLHLHSGPKVNFCRPSVDVLLNSALEVWGGRILGVVLTGMGRDGADSCKLLHEAGGPVLVQDAASSVVWGMPGAVAELGVADAVLPVPELASRISELLDCGPIHQRLSG